MVNKVQAQYIYIYTNNSSRSRRFRSSSKCGSIRRLSSASIDIGAHFHTNGLQDLFNPHIATPIFHSWQLGHDDFAGLRVHAAHDDFGDKTNVGGLCRIGVGAVNADFVETIGVVCLQK
jgi:hypothetical protein